MPEQALTAGAMNFTFCAQTDAGRVRVNNEDAVALDEAARLAVLADGMGGYSAGEVASNMATSLIGAELGHWLCEATPNTSVSDVKRAIGTCVDHANAAILEASRANARYAGMGTTLVVAVFWREQLLLGHIGDSRCYRLRGNTLEPISKDHSLLQEQLDAGWLTPAQAVNSPIRNLVTRALGVDTEVQLELHVHRVHNGDIYLLCSDGLSDMVDDVALAAVLRQRKPLAKMADELVLLANDMGGRDNIAVVLAQAQGQTEQPRLISRWLGKQ